MTALVDTGFLYATLDKGDKNHQRATSVLAALTDDLLLPTIVLVELTYLLQARLGHAAMRLFIQRLENNPLQFQAITKFDVPRIYEFLDQYADMSLDFVDAAIVTLAERLGIQRILTVDKDFRIIRPRHCEYFEILP
ncbi:MAG: VapC toxin family PIN domain ribonuclease [Anaerolineaceae bacterium 4572_5.1]|nr:MAG: VapC toxin family PIN domain ribonuclease [Anaerolineaceae bacterium 4572_5.1]